MSRLIPIFMWIAAVSCSGGTFIGSIGERSSQGSIDQTEFTPGPVIEPPAQTGGQPTTDLPGTNSTVPEITTPTEKPKDPNPTIYRMPPGNAVIPIAVGGASLTCQPDEGQGILCGSESEAILSFIPVKAYYATNMEKTWILTTFVKVSESSYAVKLPADLMSHSIQVSVLMVNAENKFMADMNGDKEKETLINLVKDGSFELQRIDASNSLRSRSITPIQEYAWQAERTATQQEYRCEGYLELDSIISKAVLAAAEGTQWMELAARCDDFGDTRRENLGISQILSLQAGRSYRVTYAFRNSPGSTDTHQLKVTYDNHVVSTDYVKESAWTYRSFTFKAAANEVRLGFMEMAYGTRGTVIDDIMVVELKE